jgi:uncharacterized protein involved in type VI secretion and phage assembly
MRDQPLLEHEESARRRVLIDGMAAWKRNPNECYREIKCHDPDEQAEEEYIDALVPERRIASGSRLLEQTGFDDETTIYRYEESTGRLKAVEEGEAVRQFSFDPVGRIVKLESRIKKPGGRLEIDARLRCGGDTWHGRIPGP